MKFLRNRKIVYGLIAVIILVIGSFGIVSAQSGSSPAESFSAQSASARGQVLNQQPTGQPGTETAKQIGYLMYFATAGAAKLVTGAAALVNIALDLGKEVITLPVVNLGFSTALNFANLGFVLAIIVIAFSTIFQLQSYAMKQTLWKLIVAALLVNFSLVIAGGFISAANMLTDVFLQGVTADNLGTALAGLLNPQSAVQVAAPGDLTWYQKILSILDIEGWIKYIISLFFVLVFTFIILLTFFALVIMLLIRVIYLGILLILMPLAWLAWIFPGTRGYWKEWWNNFLRWAFFAPAVLFFIYLVVATGTNMANLSVFQNTGGESSINEAFQRGLVVPPGFLGHIAQVIITTGLLLGGLIAANRLGITFAKTAYGWAQGAGKGFGGWVGRKGVRLGTLPARSRLGQKAIEGMQKLGAKPGLGGFVARHTVSRLGNVLGGVGVRQGERLIKQAEERQKSLSDKQLAFQVATMTSDERAAAFIRLAKNKNLDMVPSMAKYIADPATKKIFASYGRGKEYGDLEKTFGANTAMLNAKTTPDRRKATEEFRKTYSIKDYDKMQENILGTYDSEKNNIGLSASDHEEFRKLNRETIFDKHPGAITKMRAKLKGQNFADFQKDLDDYIDKFESSINMPSNTRGITVDIKTKLKWMDDPENNVKPDLRNWARGMYNSRKNFGGSLLGSFYIAEREAGGETES